MTEPNKGENMKPEYQAAVDFIRRRRNVTFVELGNAFPWIVGGDGVLRAHGNVVLWTGISEEGETFLFCDEVGKQIKTEACSPMLYLFDGCCLKLPIAKRVPRGGYKKPRWAPHMFNPRVGE